MKVAIPTNLKELDQHIHNPLFKNAYFLIAIIVVGSVLGFVFWVVAARLYTPEEIGLATALISAMGLLSTFSKLGFDTSMIRFLPNEEDKNGMINSCLTLTCLFSIVLAAAFISGLGYWSPALLFIREKLVFSLSFIIFTAVITLLALCRSIFIAMRSSKLSFFQNTVWTLLKIPFLVVLTNFGVLGIFYSWGLAICVAFMISIFFFIPRLQSKYFPMFMIKKKIINDMMHFSLVNYIAETFGSGLIMILPLLILNVLNPEMTAYFFISWTIASVLFMISIATTTSLFAEGSNDPEKLHRNMIKTIKFTFILLVPSIIGILILGDKVLLLFGKAYSENALDMLFILAISSLPAGLNNIYIAVKRVQGKVMHVLYINAFISLFTLGSSYVLMTKIGLIGVGIGWTVSEIVVSLVIGFIVLKRRISTV